VTNIGSRHPLPENIPHSAVASPAINPAASTNGGVGAKTLPIPGGISGHPGSIGFHSRSPVKEASFLHRGTNADGSDEASEPKTDEPKVHRPEVEAHKPNMDESANKEEDLSVGPSSSQDGVSIRR
jgi:hypothetical protein